MIALTLACVAVSLARLLNGAEPCAPKHWRSPGLSMRVENGRIHYRSLAARQNRAGETT